MSDTSPVLVWFRNDLRLEDHHALSAAVESGKPLIPVYLFTPDAEGRWAPGGATRWWLHHALADLDRALRDNGSCLILRSGKEPGELLEKLMEETGADHIFWNRRYEPHHVECDTRLKKELPAKSFPGSMLWEPGKVTTQAGDPYKVFTPFYKALQKLGDPPDPLPAPSSWKHPDSFPSSEDLNDWNLLPDINWDEGFYQRWEPTLKGAESHLEGFLDGAVGDYKNRRDFPGETATSRLSPYLHFGQISPRHIWDAVRAQGAVSGGGKGVEAYTRQIVWRDFAMQMLFHHPHTDWEPLQEAYADFPWRKDAKALRAWQKGQTGYPIVDAGMRELWATGWMHNRVRMIAASFLVKDLLISWREGMLWFWDTLVDADLANNSFGWQWAGGCGADAAPYFRIFNPVLQSKKFDPDGIYIRHWVPELKALVTEDLHAPWEMDSPPEAYPSPIVDHKQARDRALEALDHIK